jgi:hypothetical protein
MRQWALKRSVRATSCAAAAFVGAVLGYGIATLQSDFPEGPSQGTGSSVSVQTVADSSTADVALTRRLTALRRDLEAERRARKALALEVARLREQWGAGVPNTEPEATALHEPQAARSKLGAAKVDPGEGLLEASPSKQEQRPWFDDGSLQQVGYANSEVEEIRRRFEELEMDKLDLADRSRRDGTINSAEYNRQLVELTSALREDLGITGYDAYLYATGKHNRVELQEVLEDSPAGYAGLEAGDIVVSYAGSRMFHPRQLKQATATGESGVDVTIEVLRDGAHFRTRVPRGPLGVRLRRIRNPPLLDW